MNADTQDCSMLLLAAIFSWLTPWSAVADVFVLIAGYSAYRLFMIGSDIAIQQQQKEGNS